MTEMSDIVNNGITDEELELAKQQTVSSILLSLEDSASRAASLAQCEITHGRQISVEESIENVKAVTADHIQTLAKEYFRSEDIAFAALGDLKDDLIGRDDLVLADSY